MADVEITDDGPVRVLRLNRADKKNALTSDMYASLADGLTTLEDREDLRVALVAATGPDFCAGNDLFDFVGPDDEDAPVTRFLAALVTATKPLVAAVRGRAVGVGATMLLHMDFVHLAGDAELRFPFVDLGLVPEAGSTMLLPRLVGYRAAADMLMLGKPVDARSAVGHGIASDVVDDPDTAAAATAVALADKPPVALRATRSLIRGAPAALLAHQLEEGDVFARLLQGPEFARSLERFGTRRSPQG